MVGQLGLVLQAVWKFLKQCQAQSLTAPTLVMLFNHNFLDRTFANAYTFLRKDFYPNPPPNQEARKTYAFAMLHHRDGIGHHLGPFYVFGMLLVWREITADVSL